MMHQIKLILLLHLLKHFYFSGNQAKATWKNLRDSYRCSLKTAKAGKSGDAAKKIKVWKFTEQMSFLIPYMKDRPRSSNMACDDEAASQLNETQKAVSDDVNENVHEIEVDCNEEQVSQDSETPSTSNENKLKRKLSQLQSDQSATPNAKKIAKAKNSPLQFLREQAKKREERSEARQRYRDVLLHSSHDSLRLFFDSMYEATKCLPLPQQRQVRKALFNAVSAAEECADNESNGTSTPTTFSMSDSGEAHVFAEVASNLQGTYVHQPNNMLTADIEHNLQATYAHQSNDMVTTDNEHQPNDMASTENDYGMLNVVQNFALYDK